jgi:hypothetical protein
MSDARRVSNRSAIGELLRRLRQWISGKPDRPDDPYSYVTAPRKPRPPHFSAAAVADRPED